MTDYRTAEEIAADAKQDALWATETAFRKLANEVSPEGINGDWAMAAWQNAFSVEVWAEYADDTQRWKVALSTLEMFVDQGGMD